jgi:hypothetical protein
MASGPLPATNRAFRTRFRYGYVAERLNLAADSDSRTHYAKGKRSSRYSLRRIKDCHSL